MPVHSLMFSFLLFFYLPYLLPRSTVPYKMALARPDEGEIRPYHFSLRHFVSLRRSLFGPIACWILAQTFLLVTWSLYEMHSILRKRLISMARILLSSSAARVHDSQAYKHTGSIQEAYRKHTGSIQEAYRKHTGSIQEAYRQMDVKTE